MNMQVTWTPGITLEQMERNCILVAFKFYEGNKTRCSIALGIAVRTLETKLEKYGKDDASQKEIEDKDARARIETSNRLRGLKPDGTIIGQVNEYARVGTDAETQRQNVLNATAGVRVEPTIDPSPKHAVSVPEHKEVQSVLPSETSQSHKHKRR